MTGNRHAARDRVAVVEAAPRAGGRAPRRGGALLKLSFWTSLGALVVGRRARRRQQPVSARRRAASAGPVVVPAAAIPKPGDRAEAELRRPLPAREPAPDEGRIAERRRRRRTAGCSRSGGSARTSAARCRGSRTSCRRRRSAGAARLVQLQLPRFDVHEGWRARLRARRRARWTRWRSSVDNERRHHRADRQASAAATPTTRGARCRGRRRRSW